MRKMQEEGCGHWSTCAEAMVDGVIGYWSVFAEAVADVIMDIATSGWFFRLFSS